MIKSVSNPRRLYHKKIRLDKEIYEQSGQIASVTICTNKRMPVFGQPNVAETCLDILLGYVAKNRIPIFAYCMMPDHLHLLISPTHTKGIVDIVRDLKAQMSYHAKNKGLVKRGFWQTSFYDHFLRNDESLRATVSYLLNNRLGKEL